MARLAILVASVILVLGGATPALAGERLALLVTRGDEPVSRLVLVDPAALRVPDGGVSVEHLPGAMVRGAMMPDGRTAMVVADRTPGRDRSWGASLLRVDARVTELCDRVDHASRPLVTSDGRVFVARGHAGSIARAGELRSDALTIEEIDPASGAARVLWRGRGYQAHLAGAAGGEVIVYHVFAGGAAILGLPMTGGAPRVIVPALLPYARDFSIADGRLVFSERDDGGRGWVVEEVELASGARRRLLPASQLERAPFALPGGEVAVAGEGLTMMRGGVRAPAGAGMDVVRAVGDALMAVWHYGAGGALTPDVLILDRDGRLRAHLPAPARTRLEIVGFVR